MGLRLTEQPDEALPGIARRRGRFRHRVGVEMLIRARIVGRVHQRDHRLGRPCFAALVADPGGGLGRLARGRGAPPPWRSCGAGAAFSTAGSAASITGRLTPISASGSRHWKPSSRPFGVTGSQRSDTTPSAVHAGSPEARMARAIHSRTRPSSPCSALLDLRHQRGDAPRRRRDVGRQRRARGGKFARIERGARHRERAFELARQHAGELLHARQPSRARVAEPQIGIGLGDVGMRIGGPGRFQNLARLALLAGFRQPPSRPSPPPAPDRARA